MVPVDKVNGHIARDLAWSIESNEYICGIDNDPKFDFEYVTKTQKLGRRVKIDQVLAFCRPIQYARPLTRLSARTETHEIQSLSR